MGGQLHDFPLDYIPIRDSQIACGFAAIVGCVKRTTNYRLRFRSLYLQILRSAHHPFRQTVQHRHGHGLQLGDGRRLYRRRDCLLGINARF